MYYPMYSLCHCPLFSDLSPRSFPTRVSGFPTKITSPPSPILNEPAILFHHWSAVSHPSQRPIYLRHVSVTKCPLFSDRSPRSSWSAGLLSTRNSSIGSKSGGSDELGPGHKRRYWRMKNRAVWPS